MNPWKIATGVLVVAVIAQFVWWDRQAPEVLRGRGYLPTSSTPPATQNLPAPAA